MRELLDILNRVERPAGSMLMVYAWYRSQPLPGFGGQTAMQLIQENRASAVHDYLDAVEAGVFA